MHINTKIEFEAFISCQLSRSPGQFQAGRYLDPEISLFWDIWQGAVASVHERHGVVCLGVRAQPLVRPDELCALLGSEVMQ